MEWTVSARLLLAAAIALGSLQTFAQETQEPGTWQNVTPQGWGEWASTIQVDPARPSDAYVWGDDVGCWRSTDYGLTWRRVDAAGGLSGTGISGHGAWCTAIDRNPNRNPETSPAIYVTMGYAENGIWRSTDWGVTWVDMWNDNIYAPDGVTNIYSDVGRDIAYFYCVDPGNSDHMIAALHSYWGDGDNNGVFESTNGGETWLLHKSATFNFQPHSDVLFPIDRDTWCVTHGSEAYVTTDRAESWSRAAGSVTGSAGNAICNRMVGGTFYISTDHTGGLYKTTDKGQSWSLVDFDGSRTQWVLATDTKIYAANAYDWDPTEIYWCPIDDDTEWHRMPVTLPGGGHRASMTHNGTNYVILFPAHAAGIWRYVEPAAPTVTAGGKALGGHEAVSPRTFVRPVVDGRGVSVLASGAVAFDVRGRRLSTVDISRQVIVVKTDR
jgi:hypothetical protein